MRCLIVDSTLREGEQTPGIYFSHRQKLSLARLIDATGVDVIEAGVPAMGEVEQTTLKALARLNLRAELVTWNRVCRKDLEAALRTGIRSAHVAVPVSGLLIRKKLRTTPARLLARVADVLEFARGRGLRVSVGAEDASRASPILLVRLAQLAESFGAVRFRYADTLGIMAPEHAAAAVTALAAHCGVPVEFHAHNDFGLALANTLAAVRAGARAAGTAALGLGERAGHTDLAELAGALRFVYRRRVRVDLRALGTLYRRLPAVTGMPLRPNAPLYGRNAFTHESGIHVDAQLKDPSCYEPLAPWVVAARRVFVTGKYSGRAGVRCAARTMGHEISNEAAGRLLLHLRRTLSATAGLDAAGVFRRILREEVNHAAGA